MNPASKKYLFISSIVVTLLLLSFVTIMQVKKQPAPKNVLKGFAVVELFTSEGCSSCPPADAVIAQLLKKNISNVYILSFHVDYWNRLGWKDEFSNEENSARQQHYARALNLEGVYTPQVIVNGTSQFVGSDENALSNSVSDNLKHGKESALKISAIRKGNTVTLHFDIAGTEKMFLNCAMLLPEATTKVKRGENGGRTLHHVNIVKYLKVIDAKCSGELMLEIPGELINQKFKIIAYTQTTKNLHITGADEVDF